MCSAAGSPVHLRQSVVAADVAIVEIDHADPHGGLYQHSVSSTAPGSLHYCGWPLASFPVPPLLAIGHVASRRDQLDELTASVSKMPRSFHSCQLLTTPCDERPVFRRWPPGDCGVNELILLNTMSRNSGATSGRKLVPRHSLFTHAKIPAIALVDESASAIRTPFDDKFRLVFNDQTVSALSLRRIRSAQNAIPFRKTTPKTPTSRQHKQSDNQRDDKHVRFQRRSSFKYEYAESSRRVTGHRSQQFWLRSVKPTPKKPGTTV